MKKIRCAKCGELRPASLFNSSTICWDCRGYERCSNRTYRTTGGYVFQKPNDSLRLKHLKDIPRTLEGDTLLLTQLESHITWTKQVRDWLYREAPYRGCYEKILQILARDEIF